MLDEIMAVPARNIPQSLLREAEGVAIVPNVVKLGFILGVRQGWGVLLVRDRTGAWGRPTFITLAGGSVGWQAGIQATDVILVFKSRRSIQGLMRGKFTLGADASVAAGPIGRKAAAATDLELRAEIYSYSRSRGLFAGVALHGTALSIDHLAHHRYYAAAGAGPPGLLPAEPVPAWLPPEARRLMERLARYSARPAGPPPAIVPGPGPQPVDSVRKRLAASAAGLYALLDPRWKAYLALPPGVFAPGPPADAESLAQALRRYDTVAADPKYRRLASRSEFAATHQLLRQYLQLRTATATLDLPPPPSEPGPADRPAARY